jgi:menaquinone-dependent protoporphyrinogen oxidase
MDKKVLVAYASKYGATAEIAEKIGEVLEKASVQVDVTPVKEVKDLTPYGAVVLGTAAYIFKWRKDAVKFLNSNEKALAGMPVWIFMSGPAGEGDPVKLLEGRVVPEGMKPVVERIKPVDLTVFHGVIQLDKMNIIERQMMKMVKSPEGDYRDWDAITAWANGIADKVKG